MIFAGSAETTLYIVESGAVELRETSRSKSGSLIEASAERGKAGQKRSEETSSKYVLRAGMYFGSNSLMSLANDSECFAKRSAYAIEDSTKLLTISAKDFKRIVGQAWVKRTATKLFGNNPEMLGDDQSGLQGSSLGDSSLGVGSSSRLKDGSKWNSKCEDKVISAKVADKTIVSDVPTLSKKSSRATIDINDSFGSDLTSPSGRSQRAKTMGEVSLVELPEGWRDTAIKSLDDIHFKQTIGKGSFGRVILASVKGSKTERLVAVKKLSKADLAGSGCAPHVLNERGALAISNSCPYIINLYQTFSDAKHLYFVLELCRGGDLFGLLCKCERIIEKSARFYVAAVVKAFAFMHSKDIVYRDLKPENLLVQENGYLKLADLGLAKAVPEGVTYTLCGTPVYMAPEMLLSSGHGKPADAWAVGIMIYELCAGYPPFEGEDQMGTYEMIINSNVIWPTADLAADGHGVSSVANGGADAENDMKEVGRRESMWGVNVTPSYRLSSSTKSIITGLLEKDPTHRLGAATDAKGPFEDVIRNSWFSRFDWDLYKKEKMTPPARPAVSNWEENFEKWDEEEEAAIDQEAEPFIGDDFADF